MAIGGCCAKYSAPSSPDSSAVVITNIIDLPGLTSARAFDWAIMSKPAQQDALSYATLKIRSVSG
ncbi:MAG: hypothetical protein ACRD1H_20745, partial [Vicinamibacterales bacterium]